MQGELRQQLAAVRRRLRLRSAIVYLGAGAFVGGLLVLLLSFARMLQNAEISLQTGLAVFFISALAGGLTGLFQRRSWDEAASCVDQHYQLQDQVVSALQFADQPQPSAFHQLQLADTDQRLQQVQPAAVVPLSPPPRWPWTIGVMLLAARLLMTPITGDERPPEALPDEVQRAAAVQEITTEIDRLEQLAHDSAAEDLQEMVGELKRKLQRLKQNEATQHESLKTVSEMQQQLKSLGAELNVAAMDAELQKIAEALASATPFKPAADALQNQDLQDAAEQLEQVSADELSPENLDRAQLDPTTEKLAQAAQAAREQGMNDLSDTLDKLAEAMKTGDSQQAQRQSQQLAETVKRHSVNRELSKILDKSSEQMAQSKQRLSVQSQSEGEGEMSGTGQNLAKGKTQKTSTSSSQKAGAKSAGNIDGQKTQLESQRQMARLSGQLGEDGDSEVEITTSPDAQQTAQRQAQQTFAEYQKMSEAVLESESIPLGHRQTIRRYFERIRPSASEPSELPAQP